MMGKSHIVCTSAMAATILCVHDSLYKIRIGMNSNFWGLSANKLSLLQNIDEHIWKFTGLNDNILSVASAYKILLFFVFVIFGTLCTDCDSEKSIIGRILHIPVEHHTWLHAIWIPALCAFAGLAFSPAMWFALGWFLHEFMDSFSRCGNSYLYPFVGYNKYGNAKSKKGIHNFKFYYVGKKSETIFVVCVVLTCIFLCLLFILAPNYHIDITGEGFGVLK
jgi:hypothetical protein